MISAITMANAPVSAEGTKEKAALRQACQEVEGLFVSLLMKEGLNPVLDDSQEGSGIHDNVKQYAIEQTARDLGHQGSLGISKFLYDELSVLL